MAVLIEAIYPEPAMVFVGEGDPMPKAPKVGREVKPANGTDFKLEELYALVCHRMENGKMVPDEHALVEHNTLPDGRHVIGDEEGKLKGLPVNVDATMIWREAWKTESPWAAADTLVGNILICAPDELR